MKTNNFSGLLPRLLAVGVCCIACSGTVAVHGQDSAFTYQGQLTDNGSPVSGVYDFRFTIYDSAIGAIPLVSPVTNSLTPVNNGRFSVTVDFGPGLFTGDARWLQVGARTNGAGAFTPLEPRQRISATPYAITARSVSGNVDANQLAGTIQSANIGAGTITGTMLASDSVHSNALALSSVHSNHLAVGSVHSNALALASIHSNHLAVASIHSNHLAAGSIHSNALALGSVTASALAIGSIHSNHLAEGSVHSNALVLGSIHSNHLALGSVHSNALALASIHSNHLAVASVHSNHLAVGSVTASTLADGTVTSAKIATGTLTLANLAQEVVDRLLPPGTIVAYAGSVAPGGWVFCNGSIRNAGDPGFGALFAAIGKTYGVGDGSPPSFNLPDLRGRTVIGAGQGSGLSNRTLASNLGIEAITQVPNHSHPVNITTSSSGAHNHTVEGWNSSGGGLRRLDTFGDTASTTSFPTSTAGAHTHSVSGTTGNNSGGVASVDNLQPSLVLHYIIKL